MHKTLRSLALLAAIFTIALAALSFIASPAFSQETATAPAASLNSAAIETAAAVAQPFIVTAAQKWSWLITVLAAVGALRLVFKPIMSGVELYVKSTPQASDDEALARVQHSAAFRAFAWLVDYLGSIKVGPRAPQPEARNS